MKGCAEGLATQSFCRDLGLEIELMIWSDSAACDGICNRTGLGSIKHMDARLLWLQDAVGRERARVGKVRGDGGPAGRPSFGLGSSGVGSVCSPIPCPCSRV